ncbi:MAG: ribonuclease J, partial [Clostridia bacterium]|nr:ribonuclease J [Clostridia bacterium]
DIVSRGFVYVRESEEIMDEMRQVAYDAAVNCIENDIRDWASIKSSIRDEVGQLVYERTRRAPMILPIIMEV